MERYFIAAGGLINATLFLAFVFFGSIWTGVHISAALVLTAVGIVFLCYRAQWAGRHKLAAILDLLGNGLAVIAALIMLKVWFW